MSKLEGDRPKRAKTGGRSKGTPNKTTGLLKEAVLEAGKLAGGKEGLVGYLQVQASQNPGPFMALLGKVLPLQVTGVGDGPIHYAVEIRIVDPN